MTESNQKTSSNSKLPQNPLNQEQKKIEQIIPTSNYKLYYGGYLEIKGLTVAESTEEAINNLRVDLNLPSLPCYADELTLPNYTITLTPKESR
jgi:hypothetical protein